MIRYLELFDFRNYTKKMLTFESACVVLYGQNGKGKTNVLEALFLLSTGKSWREKTSQDLIKKGETSSLVRGQTNTGDTYEVRCQQRGKTLLWNEKKVTLKNFFGKVPVILFVPEYLSLFRGAKSDRVTFFDRFLFQLDPLYRENLTRAMKAVKQKNSLLKNEYVTQEDIHPWNEILIETVPVIYEARKKFIEELVPPLQSKVCEIANNDDLIDVSVHLAEDYVPTPDGVREWCEKNILREIAARRGFLGPQRDDFIFWYRDELLTATASRGEERSILLALLSAQKEMYKKHLQKSPILLLDDVFSELDQSRQNQLEKLCEDTEQVFFTTTHKDHFDGFSGDVQVFEVTDSFCEPDSL